VLVTLHDLDGSGFLQGLYASTMNTSHRAKEPTLKFSYSRADARFGEVMAYHWITECQHYLQSLGFVNANGVNRGINIRSIPVDAHYDKEDNSFYTPDGQKGLQFGDGGVRDSEDAEVILHELGHAIQDAQVPGLTVAEANSETRAMGEGFGDYWAASFFAAFATPNWPMYWDKWDGQVFHASDGTHPPYFRRLNTAKN